MTVAVTGAAGFIGSAVVRLLVERGRRVRALVAPGDPASNLDGLDVERVSVDVCDDAGMQRALKGCHTLYHLAAIYRTWMPDRALLYRVNLGGTTTTLLAAQKAGVSRIVHTSSIAAVGIRDDGAMSDETTAFNLFDIADDYVLSKHLSEQIVMRFVAAGAPIVIVNPGFPFGPRDLAPTPTGRIIWALMQHRVPGHSNGGFSAIDVDDLAMGHLLAEEKGRIGERYILVNHNVTVTDFMKIAARLAGVFVPPISVPNLAAAGYGAALEWWADHISHKEPMATYHSVRYLQKQVFFDNRKAREELGLPSRPLEETIQRAIDWFALTQPSPKRRGPF